MNPLTTFSNIFTGVPQGAATSPILSSLVTKDTIFSKFDTLMYADDGFYYNIYLGEVKRTLEEAKRIMLLETDGMIEAGVSFNKEKSGWVKKDGI